MRWRAEDSVNQVSVRDTLRRKADCNSTIHVSQIHMHRKGAEAQHKNFVSPLNKLQIHNPKRKTSLENQNAVRRQGLDCSSVDPSSSRNTTHIPSVCVGSPVGTAALTPSIQRSCSGSDSSLL